MSNVVHGFGIVAVAWLVVLSACSSSSSTSAKNGGGAAASQCNTVVEKICTKTAACQQQTQAECVDANNQYLKQTYGDTCSGADQVSSTYDTCLTDLDQVTCSSQLPTSCKDVIIFFIQK